MREPDGPAGRVDRVAGARRIPADLDGSPAGAGYIIPAVPIWPRVLVAIASAKVVIAFALYFSGSAGTGTPPPLPLAVYAALAAAFCIVGLTLVAANRHDVRALWLGGVFVLASTQLSTPLVPGSAAGEFGWLRAIRVDAFLPALLWRFAAEFPSRLTGRPARAARLAWQAAAVIGLLLALVSLSSLAWAPARGSGDWRDPLTRLGGTGTLYYLLVYGLSVAVFPLLIVRAHQARENERQRVILFAAGLVGGSMPLILQVILETIPSYNAFAHRPGTELVIGVILFGALAAVPFVTAYSVLFDRVVELRVVLRAALQYGLARYTILGVTMVPFAALIVLVVEHREEPLIAFLSGPRPIALAVMAAGGFATLRLRRRWLAALDRRYFREQHDARRTLERLAGDALRVVDARDLGSRIREAIERALHADAVLFVANEERGVFRRPEGGTDVISTTAILVQLSAADKSPMDIDPNNDRSPFRRLPLDEQRWLLDGAFRLLLALPGADGRPVGLLALTQKRSGLEYADEDRQLLAAVGAATSLALDNLRLRSTPDAVAAPAAFECPACTRLSRPDAAACACGSPLVVASAPYVLRGVYRLERRIGTGGMGVVYLARDLDLDRPVAVKTLPRVTSGGVARLRAEARAMAAIVHPNLAVVHGIETWRGIPFLVEEYLPGGTLADALAQGPSTVGDALDLGITLADVLACLHDAGIVHRDVKPSNIGFTLAGVVKLLDFGLARLVGAAAAESEDSTTGDADRAGSVRSSEHKLVGTPPYMAPEALLGHRPQPAFDLWSLAVVLYESLTGRRPFRGRDAGQIVIPDGAPPPSALRAECAGDVDGYFARAFSPDAASRQPDAKAVRNELQRLRSVIG